MEIREEEEALALDRYEKAFKEHRNLFFLMHRRFQTNTPIARDDDLLRKFDDAKIELDEAQRDIDRIVNEIRSGKRK